MVREPDEALALQHDLRIHVRYPTQAVGAVTPEFANALWRCMSLSKRATQLVPASVGDAEPTRTFFFAALGFLAGFNERFATGVLSRAGAGASTWLLLARRPRCKRPDSVASEFNRRVIGDRVL